MRLIGFLAKRQRGKDTICDYITKHHNYQKKSFAEPLKKGVQCFFNFTDEQLYTDKKEIIDDKWGVSPREVFQIIGTNIVRDQFDILFNNKIKGETFWIQNFNIWYDKQYKNILVSDIRYQNEVDYVLNKGGIVIKINRELKEEDIDNHKSEKDMEHINNYNISIDNNGTLQELYSKINWIMKNLNTIHTKKGEKLENLL
jgi:hypothetical protein